MVRKVVIVYTHTFWTYENPEQLPEYSELNTCKCGMAVGLGLHG